jgi:hypothetical protein
VGSRSKGRARAQASVAPEAVPQRRPLSVVLAAVVQAVQSVAVLAAAVYAGVSAIQGKSYQNSSGIALTAIGIGTAICLAMVALGLVRVRRWSRTPALLTQLFTGIVGIYLVQGGRMWMGAAAIALSAAGFVLLLVPPSLRALMMPPTKPAAPSR